MWEEQRAAREANRPAEEKREEEFWAKQRALEQRSGELAARRARRAATRARWADAFWSGLGLAGERELLLWAGALLFGLAALVLAVLAAVELVGTRGGGYALAALVLAVLARALWRSFGRS